jgi:hypothetical protein
MLILEEGIKKYAALSPVHKYRLQSDLMYYASIKHQFTINPESDEGWGIRWKERNWFRLTEFFNGIQIDSLRYLQIENLPSVWYRKC